MGSDNSTGISLESFVRDYGDALYRYLRKLTGSGEDAEDMLQETLIKIAENLPDLHDPSRIKTWALRIATNTAMDFFRKKVKYDYTEFNEILHDTEVNDRGIEDKVIVDEMNECIRKEMNRIAPHYNTVLVLYFFEHMTVTEIANICDISVSAVKLRLHRGKILLSRILSEGCNFYLDDNSNIRCYSKSHDE